MNFHTNMQYLFVEVPHSSLDPRHESSDAKFVDENFDSVLIADGEAKSVSP